MGIISRVQWMEVLYTAGFIMAVDSTGVLREWEEATNFYPSFQSNETSRAFVS
jgi:hypothetical protein